MKSIRIETETNSIIIGFDYDPKLVSAVKRIPGAYFRKESKTWRTTISDNSIRTAALIAEEHGFPIPEEMKDLILKAKASQEEKLKFQTLTDADITIPGFKKDPFPFQRVGIAFGMQVKRALIADAPGLGKTVQSIGIVEALQAHPAIVIVPSSLKLNWKREIEELWTSRRSIILSGKKVTKSDILGLERFSEDADYLIINYDIVGDWLEALKAVPWKAIIMDEVHMLKTHTSIRSKAVKELAAGIDIRLGLSGTPILNRPKELIAQLTILDRLNDVGGYNNFIYRYCNAHMMRFGKRQFLNIDGASHLDELNQKLSSTCMIRRRKEDVLRDLPPKQRVLIPVEITNREKYSTTELDVIAWFRERAGNDQRFLEKIAYMNTADRAIEIERHQNSAEERARRAEAMVRIEALKQVSAEGKLEPVSEWIDNFLVSGEKLVIFANHIHIQKSIREKYKALSIIGEDSIEERQAAVDKFQTDPNVKVIVCSIKAGGLGITLTAANTVVFIEMGWSPGEMEQCSDRTHRIGQKDAVTINYFIGSKTIDDDIYKLLEKKQTIIDSAIDGKEIKEEINVFNELVGRLLAKDA